MSNSDMLHAYEDCEEDGNAWGRRESARMKQIQIGKARPEYQRYIREMPPSQRRPLDPSTPDPTARISKRQFDRALGEWRRHLHEYDLVPRNATRSGAGATSADAEASWNDRGQNAKAWGAPAKKAAGGGSASYQQLLETSGNRRARGGRWEDRSGGGRWERSTGRFGPRKPVGGYDDLNDESEVTPMESLTPPPPPPFPDLDQTAGSSQQSGAVQISLAGHLSDMLPPMVAQVPSSSSEAWQAWYAGMDAAWNVETPQKDQLMWMPDMQFAMETPPDKPMMPSWNMNTMQPYDLLQQQWDNNVKAVDINHQPWDENALKPTEDAYTSMPVESAMIPQRLFDSSPEKSEPGHMLENSDDSETTNSGDNSPGPLRKAEEPASPRGSSQPNEMMSLLSPGLSPSLHCLTTPVRKPNCFVAETPSPDRMHCSIPQTAWTQPTMPYSAPPYSAAPFLPWHLAAQGNDQVMPEFMQMMSPDFQQQPQQMIHTANI